MAFLFEIDYLWVGDKTNTGDAIAMRFTRPDTGTQAVVIIDGGTHDSGGRLVTHVQKYYATSVVDLVVCTHPDDDHIMGLFEVFEGLTVRQLLIHRPSHYGFGPESGTKSQLVEDLIAAAGRSGVLVDYLSYAGSQFFGGALVVAGPTEDYYIELLREQLALEKSAMTRLVKKSLPVLASAVRKLQSVFGDPGETMTGDNGGTTPRNNTSIVLDLQVDGQRMLFTGDAGAPALERAADALDTLGRSREPIELFDVPHHGSRHNLTPTLLDRLLGHRTDEERGVAVASVGKEAGDHPRAEVANAIRRRGYPVFCTRGISVCWPSVDAPSRADYGATVQPLDWLSESEDTA